MAVVTLGALIGNILVIAAVYRTPSLRTSTNYYYVNMAASDFLSSLTTWPLYLTNEIITSSGSLLQGPLATVGCKVGVFCRIASIIVSILSLVLIAVERFVAIYCISVKSDGDYTKDEVCSTAHNVVCVDSLLHSRGLSLQNGKRWSRNILHVCVE